MLAFVLVLVLMLTYQVGRQIKIVEIDGPDQAQVLRDKARVAAVIESLDESAISVGEELGRQKITFGSEVLFEPGSPDLNPAGRALIGRLAQAVTAEGIETLAEIQVGGHTDPLPTGEEPVYTNLELSADRATNVVRSLTRGGIDPGEVRLSATGYGQYVPVTTNETVEGRRANRRIEVRLVYDQPRAPASDA